MTDLMAYRIGDELFKRGRGRTPGNIDSHGTLNRVRIGFVKGLRQCPRLRADRQVLILK